MPKKYPIVDPDAAVAALNELVDTINATGGVTPYYEDRSLQANTPTPVADEDWVDLAAVYALACRALGLPMQTNVSRSSAKYRSARSIGKKAST